MSVDDVLCFLTNGVDKISVCFLNPKVKIVISGDVNRFPTDELRYTCNLTSMLTGDRNGEVSWTTL